MKFEHRNGKGCSYGPPYEWQVYKYVKFLFVIKDSIFVLHCTLSYSKWK